MLELPITEPIITPPADKAVLDDAALNRALQKDIHDAIKDTLRPDGTPTNDQGVNLFHGVATYLLEEGEAQTLQDTASKAKIAVENDIKTFTPENYSELINGNNGITEKNYSNGPNYRARGVGYSGSANVSINGRQYQIVGHDAEGNVAEITKSGWLEHIPKEPPKNITEELTPNQRTLYTSSPENIARFEERLRLAQIARSTPIYKIPQADLRKIASDFGIAPSTYLDKFGPTARIKGMEYFMYLKGGNLVGEQKN